jgi:hypothetical protein
MMTAADRQWPVLMDPAGLVGPRERRAAPASPSQTAGSPTIGNFWFTKSLLHHHGRHRVIVVTSGWHAPRVRYLTQMIWGPSYVVVIEPVRDEQSMRPTEEIAVWEAGLLAVSRRWFARSSRVMMPRSLPSGPGNTPVYADHPRTSLARLADMVTRYPDRC